MEEGSRSKLSDDSLDDSKKSPVALARDYEEEDELSCKVSLQIFRIPVLLNGPDVEDPETIELAEAEKLYENAQKTGKDFVYNDRVITPPFKRNMAMVRAVERYLKKHPDAAADQYPKYPKEEASNTNVPVAAKSENNNNDDNNASARSVEAHSPVVVEKRVSEDAMRARREQLFFENVARGNTKGVQALIDEMGVNPHALQDGHNALFYTEAPTMIQLLHSYGVVSEEVVVQRPASLPQQRVARSPSIDNVCQPTVAPAPQAFFRHAQDEVICPLPYAVLCINGSVPLENVQDFAIVKGLTIGNIRGKGSFIKALCPGYKSTLGADFSSAMLPNLPKAKVQLWDTTGQERFGNMTRIYCRNSHFAFLFGREGVDLNRILEHLPGAQLYRIDIETRTLHPIAPEELERGYPEFVYERAARMSRGEREDCATALVLQATQRVTQPAPLAAAAVAPAPAPAPAPAAPAQGNGVVNFVKNIFGRK